MITRLCFDDAVEEYLGFLRRTRAKSSDTIYKEELSLQGWSRALVNRKLARITLNDIREYASDRAEMGASNRTINLDVIALNNLLKWFSEKLPTPLPTERWTPLKHTTPLRRLIPNNTVEIFCAEAARRDEDGANVYDSGEFISDFIKLLAYSGARKTAALNARWSMVNWEAKQIAFFGKYDKTVNVDFNPKLGAHLADMRARRADPSNDFFFPGETFDTVISPYDVFNRIREKIGQPELQLHDFRHWFISRAVMSGIDWITIARWVGHADGGILIAKVYGHLNNIHLQRQAAKMVLDDEPSATSIAFSEPVLTA